MKPECTCEDGFCSDFLGHYAECPRYIQPRHRYAHDTNVLWYWRASSRCARIHLVNDLYRYQVIELWPSRYPGELQDGKILTEGYRPTLAEAKQAVFQFLL